MTDLSAIRAVWERATKGKSAMSNETQIAERFKTIRAKIDERAQDAKWLFHALHEEVNENERLTYGRYDFQRCLDAYEAKQRDLLALAERQEKEIRELRAQVKRYTKVSLSWHRTVPLPPDIDFEAEAVEKIKEQITKKHIHFYQRASSADILSAELWII